MIQKIQINQAILEIIISTLLGIENKIQSFHIGVTAEGEIDTYSHESTTNLALEQFVQQLKKPVHASFNVDHFGSTVRVKIGSCVVGCYSPARREVREAIALVYAYHAEMEYRYGRLDDEVIDMLLLQLNSWQKKHLPENTLAILMAQKMFKPEVVS